MGPKTTPSLISKGGYQIPPPLMWDEIDTPCKIGLTDQNIKNFIYGLKIQFNRYTEQKLFKLT